MKEAIAAVVGVVLIGVGFWLVMTTEPTSGGRGFAAALILAGAIALGPGMYRLHK